MNKCTILFLSVSFAQITDTQPERDIYLVSIHLTGNSNLNSGPVQNVGHQRKRQHLWEITWEHQENMHHPTASFKMPIQFNSI